MSARSSGLEADAAERPIVAATRHLPCARISHFAFLLLPLDLDVTKVDPTRNNLFHSNHVSTSRKRNQGCPPDRNWEAPLRVSPSDPEPFEPDSTTLIVRRLVGGDDDALSEYLVRHKERLVRSANRMLRDRRIDDGDLDAEGAVNLAFAKICRLRGRGMLDRIAMADDFAKLMATILRRVVGDQQKRSEATRRGGAGSVGTHGDPWNDGALGGIRRTDADLDALPSSLPRSRGSRSHSR